MVRFLSDGNLYPGIHRYTKLDFEQQFVGAFAASTSRRVIYTNFCAWVKQLIGIAVPRYLWLDGSYLTTKVNPNDIDVVVFFSPNDVASQQQADDVHQVIGEVARRLTCDAYLALTFDFAAAQTEQAFKAHDPESATRQTYWMGQFGFDRNRQPKGIVQLDQNELIKF